jgi:hypothetical protein
MNKQIYYRRKDKSIIIEGKQDGKSILIWTLPDPESLLKAIVSKASFLTKEKSDKIVEKVKRLDIKQDKPVKVTSKVPTITITRTSKKDAKEPIKHIPTEEEIKLLEELTKE